MKIKTLIFPIFVVFLSILACTNINIVNNSSNYAVVSGNFSGESGQQRIPPGGTGTWLDFTGSGGIVAVLPDEAYIAELDSQRIETDQLIFFGQASGEVSSLELIALKFKMFALKARIDQLKLSGTSCVVVGLDQDVITVVVTQDLLSGRWACSQQ